jgi:hypothetical protein
MNPRAVSPRLAESCDGARYVVVARLAGTRYESRVLEQLDIALSFEDPEYMALLAAEPDSGPLVGLVMFGAVAGAQRVTKLHVLIGDDAGICAALASAVRTVAADSGERMVVTELADDPVFRDPIGALRETGFDEEGHVEDFVRDGVGLRILVWRAGST